MKHIKLMFFTIFFVIVAAISSFARSYSPFWFQEGEHWKVRDSQGNIITNARLCDSTNGQNHWYILDANGNMVVCDLVQDSHGSYYSIETSPNEDYGTLRCQSGYYNGVFLDIDPSSGVIKNQDGINALKSGGCGVFFINHDNFAYTSSMASTSSSSGNNIDDDNVVLDETTAIEYAKQILPNYEGLYIKPSIVNMPTVYRRGSETRAWINLPPYTSTSLFTMYTTAKGALVFTRTKNNIRTALQLLIENP